MNKNKIIFYLVWLGLLSLGPISVLANTNLSLTFTSRVLTMNFIQRLLGVTAFTMLFTQIILGTYMQRWTEKLGGWVQRFHIVEGVTAYIIAFLHPLFFVLFNYFYGKPFDPFYVFTQVCLLCGNTREYYIDLGRIGFWLLTVGVFAGIFRSATPFMRIHWKKFHVINYLTFLIIGIHGFSIGTDFMTIPFIVFAIVAYLVTLYIVIFKRLSELLQNIRRWFI